MAWPRKQAWRLSQRRADEPRRSWLTVAAAAPAEAPLMRLQVQGQEFLRRHMPEPPGRKGRPKWGSAVPQEPDKREEGWVLVDCCRRGQGQV